jgi:DNA repair protein RadD
MQPRSYQLDSITALYTALRNGVSAPLVCLPTGAGKSVVVSTLCCDAVTKWSCRVLVLVHVKELVAQLADSVRRAWPDAFCPLGILSAGLGQKSIDTITVAGIQSAFRRSTDIGRVDVVIIDEAHLVPPDGEGMYRTLLAELRIINPKLRLIGLTATPYRLGHGMVVGDDNLFQEMVHDVSVRELMDAGYLCRVRGKGKPGPNLENVHHRGGEFLACEVDAIMEDDERVRGAVAEILRHGADRQAWLIFCCSVKHAGMVSEALAAEGVQAPVITGETPVAERDDLIAGFKARTLRGLVNVNVLTTGFDAPHVDLIVLLRPTESPGLYYQMVGRGFRVAPGKADCLLLDLAGNIERHGPIETLNERIVTPGEGAGVSKYCPACDAVNPGGAACCGDCGSPFFKRCKNLSCLCDTVPWDAENCPACGRPMRPQARHTTEAAEGDPIVAEVAPPSWHDVDGVEYQDWEKRGAPDAPHTLRVDYFSGYSRVASEWVCIDHQGFARDKAIRWIAGRLRPGVELLYSEDGTAVIDALPLTVSRASSMGQTWFRCPRRIATQVDGKWLRVVDAEFDDDDAEVTVAALTASGADDEPPF